MPKASSREELRAVFTEFDTDGEGSINEEELSHAMRRLGIRVSKAASKKMMKLIDKDGNGTVEWDEFQAFFDRFSDPGAIKAVLSEEGGRFVDYKTLVEEDPSFSKCFIVPPSGGAAKKFQGHADQVESVAWLSDEEFVSASIDGEILVWKAADTKRRPKPERRYAPLGPIYAMAALPNGQHVLTGLGRNKENLRLRAVAAPHTTEEVGGGEGEAEEASALMLSGHSAPVFSCAVGREGSTAASGSKGGQLCFHDLDGGSLVSTFPAHDGVLYSVDISPASLNMISTASSDGTVKVFDVRGVGPGVVKPSVVIEDAATAGCVYAVRWRNNNELISCGDDYCIKRWDLRSTKQGAVSSYLGHTAAVRAIAISTDGQFLVSSTTDGSIRVWLADEMTLIDDRRRGAQDRSKHLTKQRERLQEMIMAGDSGDSSSMRDISRQLASLEKEVIHCDALSSERESLSCTQACLGLDGPTSPVVSLGWRDDALGSGVSCVIAGSHDLSVRLFQLERAGLSELQLWSSTKS